jgi:sugar phosphate permease
MEPAVVDSRFRSRCAQNWVFLGLMYAMFYMARYNLSVADPYLLQAFGWTKVDLGILKSAGLITYGISVFLNGPLADRIGGKRAILIGAGALAGVGGQMIALVCLGQLHNALPAVVVLASLQFFINAGQSLIAGAASMDFVGKKAGATAAGFFDGMQYVAGSVVGFGMGSLLQKHGWGIWPYVVLPFAFIGCLLAASLWNTLPKRRSEPQASSNAMVARPSL